jgi:hypothetical protein
MRPPLRYVLYMFGSILAVAIVSFIIFDQFLAISAICIVSVILVGPCIVQLLHYFFVKVQITKDKIVVTDYIRDPLNFLIRPNLHQEIFFSDIAYIYYADKETQLLSNLRDKIKKYGIADKETNYTKQNLFNLYGVPLETSEKFENSSQKALTDYTATGVLMVLDEIYEKYNVPKSVKKDIKASLKNDNNFNFNFLMDKLRAYLISTQDVENLKSSINDTDEQVLLPFLRTKINMGKYSRFATSPKNMMRTIPTDTTLVFANDDGTKKLYFMHFRSLSRENRRYIFEEIKRKNAMVKYLMSKQALEAIFCG